MNRSTRLLGLLVALLVAAYIFSPYFAMWRLKWALTDSDVPALISLIDLPRASESVKRELVAEMDRSGQVTEEAELLLSTWIVGLYANLMLFLSPRGMTDLLRVDEGRGDPFLTVSKANYLMAKGYSFLDLSQLEYAFYKNLNVFEFSIDGADFALERVGFGWKLTEVRLNRTLRRLAKQGIELSASRRASTQSPEESTAAITIEKAEQRPSKNTKARIPERYTDFPPDTELHVVGVYEGTVPGQGDTSPWWSRCEDLRDKKELAECHEKHARRDKRARVTVEVKRTSHPVMLLLMAHEPSVWAVSTAPGVKLEKVLVGGQGRQLFEGLPDGVPIEIYNPDTPCPGCYRGSSKLLAYESKGPEFDRLMATLVIVAGRSPTSVQTAYVGNRFVIE